MQCSECSEQYLVFSVQFVVCSVLGTVCCVQCSECSEQYLVCSVQFVVCSVLCTVRSVQCVVYTV